MALRLLSTLLSLALLCGNGAAASAPNTTYDFIVVGGGTAGLVVANRLSEDPSVTVAVIEAGYSVFNNSNVQNTTSFGLSTGTEIDWQYKTVPQKYALNATEDYTAGKALGGTSTLNGMTYIRSETVQIDVWEELGNSGWNWDSLFHYYKKSEHFEPPTPSQVANGADYNPDYHGFEGYLDVGWQSIAPQSGNASAIVRKTWENVGMPYNKDVNGGYMRGHGVWPFTLDAKTSIREDSARAYYYPVQERPNLHVYLNTTALKLVWDDEEKYGDDDSGLVANGVEISSAGRTMTLKASKEVVVSLGSTRTPCFLEYSGVGNPAILEKFDIPVRIPLPSVGENLQDQTNVALIGALKPNDTTFLGYPPYVTYPTAQDLFGTNLSTVEASVRSSIPSFAAQNVAASNNATTQAIQETLLTKQADLIFTNAATLPIAEILTAPYSTSGVAVLPTWALLPFGRGSIHIASASPLAVGANASSPAINPNFFMNAFDNAMQAAAMRYARTALTTPPLSDFVGALLSPSLDAVPADADDATWLAYAKGAYMSNAHPVGTAAMMSKELGGVVDAQLKVYGTSNVRVVDASVLPWQVCGHLTSTIYAVAERASDIIRGKVA
ncbi:hypothetical protein SLS56_001649 [Neofusicoccum ribis]|uniref:Uncharacterized protein n=1 Tax=Neofusicoccum ribis TaxID=45134 RepID=A0ABR3T8K4_9PEZI